MSVRCRSAQPTRVASESCSSRAISVAVYSSPAGGHDDRADANRVGLAYDYVAARITLRVGSALTDVGLTSLFSRVLADAGISCNVIAGLPTTTCSSTGPRAPRPGPAPRDMSARSG
jgi:hypothetical protein